MFCASTWDTSGRADQSMSVSRRLRLDVTREQFRKSLTFWMEASSGSDKVRLLRPGLRHYLVGRNPTGGANSEGW